MVRMSQAYSIRQLRKQGDSVAEIAREVEAPRSTVRNHLVKDGPTRPKHPPAPPVHARGLNARDSAIAMRAPGPAGTEAHVRHAPSTHANPTRNFWTVSQAESARNATQRRRFPRSAEPTANIPRRKPHRSPGPMAKSAPTSCGTAQNPRGRARGQGRGSRKRRRERNPKHRGAHP